MLAFGQAAGFRVYDIAQLHFNARKELLQLDVILLRSELFRDGW